MDVKLSDCDSSENLDSTWLLLNDNDLEEPPQGLTQPQLEHSNDSSFTELNSIEENAVAIPASPVDINNNQSELVESGEFETQPESKPDTANDPLENKGEEILHIFLSQTPDQTRTSHSESLISSIRRRQVPGTEEVEDYYKIYEDQSIPLKPEVKKQLDEVFHVLVILTFFSFFLTLCGLSLMFLSHCNLVDKPTNTTNGIKNTPPKSNYSYYTYYKMSEDDYISMYCTNKYKHAQFKNSSNKKGSAKDMDRRIKQFLRHLDIPLKMDLKTEKTPKNNKTDEVVEKKKWNDLQNNLAKQTKEYEKLKKKFDEQVVLIDHLKTECHLKNQHHKKCAKMMLREIVNLSKGRFEIKPARKCNFMRNLDAIIKYNNNFPVSKKEESNKVEEKPLETTKIIQEDKIIDETPVTFGPETQQTAMEKKIKTMKKENEEIIENIKNKQKKLYDLTTEITNDLRFLESKKKILQIFEERFKTFNGTSPAPTNVSQYPINIPLVFSSLKAQKSMSNEMLQKIMDDNAVDNNVCICEQEDNNEQDKTDLAFNKKKRELNNLITKKLEKINSNANLVKKCRFLAKWDDKNIFLSRKLNDREHKRLDNLYPKCNPSKGWIRANKYMH